MEISIKNILKCILLVIISNHIHAQSDESSYEFADTIAQKIEITYTPMGLLYVKSKKIILIENNVVYRYKGKKKKKIESNVATEKLIKLLNHKIVDSLFRNKENVYDECNQYEQFYDLIFFERHTSVEQITKYRFTAPGFCEEDMELEKYMREISEQIIFLHRNY